MQNSRIETLIQKYLNRKLNEREFEELKQWLEEDDSHKKLFVKLLSLRNVTNQLNLLDQFNKESSWEAIRKRCNRNRQIRRKVIYSSAAMAAMIIGISSVLYFKANPIAERLGARNNTVITEISNDADIPRATLILADRSEVQLYSNQKEINGSHISNGQIVFPKEDLRKDSVSINSQLLQNQIKVPRGSEYAVVLADGTKVRLNADSYLDFPVQFSDVREVRLQGEALFEVTHDEKRPFVVRTDNHAIYVLGTIFNVSAYPDEDVWVTLVDGRIKVSTPTGEYILAPHQQYSSRNDSISNVSPEVFTSWTTGTMEFDAMPLPDLLAKLSRYYNVNLKLASGELKDLKFTGSIFRNKPLSFALEILHRVSDVRFEKDGETILVKKQ